VSRGPGRWQRVILERVGTAPYVAAVQDIVADTVVNPTRSNEVAARRAARLLKRDGRLGTGYLTMCSERNCVEMDSHGPACPGALTKYLFVAATGLAMRIWPPVSVALNSVGTGATLSGLNPAGYPRAELGFR